MKKKTLTINDVVFIFPTDFIQSVATQQCGESCQWTAKGHVETLQLETFVQDKQLKLSVKSLQLSLKDGFHVCMLERIIRRPKGEDLDELLLVPNKNDCDKSNDQTGAVLKSENEPLSGQQTKRKRGRPRKDDSEKQKDSAHEKCVEVKDNGVRPYTLRGVKLSAEIMNAEKGIYNDTERNKKELDSVTGTGSGLQDETASDKHKCSDSKSDSFTIANSGANEKTEKGELNVVRDVDRCDTNIPLDEDDDGDSDLSDYQPTRKRKRGRPKLLRKKELFPKRKRRVIDIGNIPKFERRKRNNEKKEQCKVCGKKFCDYTGLFDHVRKRHQKIEDFQKYLDELKELKVVQCELCGQNFADRTLLHAHEDREHRQNAIVECYRCNKCFRNIVNLRNHVRSVHVLKGDKSKLCHLCPAKFKWAVTLKQHIDEIHEGNKHAKCQLCGKMFYSNSQLRRHERCHGLHKSKFVICQQCGKQFLFAHNLKRHVETMHGARQEVFHCSYCGKGFRSKNSMVTHVQLVHFNLYSFSCKECQSTFPRSKFLIDHMSSVHNITDFQVTGNRQERYKYKKNENELFYCSYCSEGFHYKAKMVDHIHSTHANVFPHHCDVCKQGFLEASFLVNHRIKAHGIVATETETTDPADVLQQLNNNNGVVTVIHGGDGENIYIQGDSVAVENVAVENGGEKLQEADLTLEGGGTIGVNEPEMTDTAAASLLVEVASGSKTYRYYIETPEGAAADGSLTVNPQDIASLLLMAEQTIQASATGDGNDAETVTAQDVETDGLQAAEKIETENQEMKGKLVDETVDLLVVDSGQQEEVSKETEQACDNPLVNSDVIQEHVEEVDGNRLNESDVHVIGYLHDSVPGVINEISYSSDSAVYQIDNTQENRSVENNDVTYTNGETSENS